MSEKVPRLDDRSSNLDFRIPERRRLVVGEVIEGMVVSIGSSTVFVDVGAKSEASLDLSEVMDEKGEAQVKVGDKVSAYIVALEPEVTLSYALARKQLNLQAIEDAREMGIPVEGRVTGVNKGGLEVDLGGARGFCPISQIDLGYCEDASVHVGKAYDFRVIEFSEGGRKLVVSRRALLEEERREAQEALQSQLQEGAQFEGTVKSLHPYGAFVDIGGMEGMVHISEIAHGHIEHPQEVLRVGQTVKVKVLKIERDPKHPDRQRVGLSIRALLGDPWQAAGMLQEGDQVDGKVVRLQPFGAFVEISPGVDGLIHISELCDRRVSHPSDVVSLGQAVKATVIKVDTAQKRISLSLRGGGGTEVAEALSVGSMVDCVVDKIKPFGLLVRIKGAMRNARGLIPAEETATGRNANLRRSFPEGTELKAMVIQVDPETGKLRLSLRAQAEHEEREELGKLMGSGAPAVTPPASLGTFGDLFKKASAPKGGSAK